MHTGYTSRKIKALRERGRKMANARWAQHRARLDAAAPAIAPRIIDTTAADNAAKRSGFDYERAILIRDERLLHSI